MKHYILQALWPAFLLACLLEVLVFAFVDPTQLYWLNSELHLSRQAVYSIAFFAFWLVSTIGCTLSILLAQSSDQLNAQSL